jgi:hypothetical protein
MAGSNQHHIPDFLLRAFRIPGGSKKQSKVWVFEKNKNARPELTKEVAAEPHFYSKLSADGSPTLDDLITDYEGPFARRYQSVRNAAFGTSVDPALAAEVVAHLTIRGAHLRTTMGTFMKTVLARGGDVFSDENKLRPLLGIDARAPSSRFEEALDEQLAKYPQAAELGIPKEVLQRMAFMIVKEQFNRLFFESAPVMALAIKTAANDAYRSASDAHNQTLASSLAPDMRTEKLTKFEWMVAPAPVAGIVLPDCIALGFEENADPQPLMLADLDKVIQVLMPLASDTILIGTRGGVAAFDLTEFNEAAAFCSQAFFVGARTGEDLESLACAIGSHPARFIDDVTSSAFAEFLKPKEASSKAVEVQGSHESDLSAQSEPSTEARLNYTVNFLDCAEQAVAERIVATVNMFASEIHHLMPVDRLEGITFAADYSAALRDLDRGVAGTSPPKPTSEEYGVGVAMALLVVRDGVIKAHVVMQAGLGHALISEDETTQQWALHALVHQLADVAFMQSFDERLPGILLSQIDDSFDAFLYAQIHAAWSGYLAARMSAIINPSIGHSYQDMLATVLERTHDSILAARLAYRSDGDINKFLGIAMPAVGKVLEYAGKVLGHFDGSGQSFLENESLNAVLLKTGLREWLAFFDSELSELWSRRGYWTSFAEFTEFNRHVERLLWQYGVIPWKTPEGQIYVTVPLVTDADRLAS